jgi:nitrogen regulatory protein P-II 1
MERLDLLIPHERLHEVDGLLRYHKAGGLTSYDIKGRVHTKNDPIASGRGVMRYIPGFVLSLIRV